MQTTRASSPATAGRVDTGTAESLKDRYLELLKNTLSYSLWEEPGMPIDTITAGLGFPLSTTGKMIQSVLRPFGMKLTYSRPGAGSREEGKIWPDQAFTMVGNLRLNQLQAAAETVIKENVRGDLIETGVWRGGSSILMRAVLEAYGVRDRKVWVCDSFEGLPKPDVKNYPIDKDDMHYKLTFDAVSLEAVQGNFKKFGLLDNQVVFLKGWFKDTLPTASIDKISVLRLDGDMYESTIQALDALYPKLSSGGFCIVDDYGLSRCKQAVEDYRKKHSINAPIQKIDWSGVYWRK